MIPMGAIPDRATRVLIGLLHTDAAFGRSTFRAVSLASGVGVGEVYSDLVELRYDGLVDWTDGTTGTLRPTVEAFPVPNQPKRR